MCGRLLQAERDGDEAALNELEELMGLLRGGTSEKPAPVVSIGSQFELHTLGTSVIGPLSPVIV